MADLRCITICWDPDGLDEPEVILGLGVGVLEAHHVLQASADAMEFICPEARVSRRAR